MVFMKNTLRFCFCLFLILVTVLGLAACDAGKNDGGSTDSAVTTDAVTEDDSAAKLVLTRNGAALFRIVYPDGCEQAVFDQVRVLRGALEDATGVTFVSESDYIGWDTVRDPEQYEIIVGRTNYEESETLLQGLKQYDHAVAIRGNKIYLTSYTAEGLFDAVQYFCDTVIAGIVRSEDGSDVFDAFEDRVYHKTYVADGMTLDGNPLSDYVVVYDHEHPMGKEMAQAVVDSVAVASGLVLPIVSDEIPEQACEILVGQTDRAESAAAADVASLAYKALLQSGKVVIGCHNPEPAAAAADAFFVNGLPSDGSVALTTGVSCAGSFLTETEYPMAEGSDLRIVSYNVLAEKYGGENTFARAEGFGALLDVYQPDAVGVQELCDAWQRYVPYHLGEDYKLIGGVRDDGETNFSAIVYNAARYELLASGVEAYSRHEDENCRNIAWAVLYDSERDVKFAFLSTHWDFGKEKKKENLRRVQADEITAKIQLLKTEYQCPVIITGDFNCNDISESYQYFMSINGMKNALVDAESYDNGQGERSIDFVMITSEDGVFKRYGKLSANGLDTLSDHRAVMVDIALAR